MIESRAWRERLFAQRAEPPAGGYPTSRPGSTEQLQRLYPGFGGMGGGMGGGMALNQLLVVMDGIDEPPLVRKVLTNRLNTFLDAMFVVPAKLGKLRLRLRPPKPRSEQIYFIGACNVPIEVLDPALTRPGRMGRHIWFRTPTKDDRLDILDLYLGKVDHEPDLDTERRRDELARITNGYSPSMIEQCCSMALTIAHTEGRREFAWRDIVEAMTTVETGTAQNIEYIQEETRAVAIHEAGHAAAGHVYLEKDVLSTRLSIRKRGGSLGHYQSMEKDERFSHFRSRVMGSLIMTLGAMAAEHVFYGENSQGVSGDVASATATAAAMVGIWAMGPDPVHISGSLELDEDVEAVLKRLERIGAAIMNRAGSPGMFGDNPVGAVLANPDKKRAAAQILGQAYVTAYALMDANRGALEAIADDADRAQGAARRRGRRAAGQRRSRPARARSDGSRDLADGMSERPARATDDTRSAPCTRASARPRRSARASPHSQRFRTATAILIGLRVAAIVIAVAVALRRPRRPGHGRGRAGRRPTAGPLGARDIADYVAPFYRISPLDQLAVVTVVNLESAAAAAAASVGGRQRHRRRQRQHQRASGRRPPQPDLERDLAAAAATRSPTTCAGSAARTARSASGTPSTSRLLLLRREALELALYTFKYIHGGAERGGDPAAGPHRPRPSTLTKNAADLRRDEQAAQHRRAVRAPGARSRCSTMPLSAHAARADPADGEPR